MKTLWFKWKLSDAIEDPRPQHAFFPEYIRSEELAPLDPVIVAGLKSKGHKVREERFSAIVQGILVDEDKRIHAKSDPRKEGVAAGY